LQYKVITVKRNISGLRSRAHEKIHHVPGRADLPLCHEFLGGAAAPPYREEFGHWEFGMGPLSCASIYGCKL
jgi:hypothetical protein